MNKHKIFLAWTLVLVSTKLIDVVFGPIEQFLARLSPLSIWQLPRYAIPAVCATLVASIIAWVSAVLIGGVLGFITAAGSLATRENGWIWRLWGAASKAIRQSYTMLYVVPLVLTISLITTILLRMEADREIGQVAIGLILIVASGAALAGQRIFVAIDDAISNAKTDDLLFSSSLFLAPPNPSFIQKIVRVWRMTRFLIACRVELLTQALEQAFHLAVVGVVILETVSGLRIYEYFYNGGGPISAWTGGIGRVILDGRNSTNPSLVSGAVWLILLIDSALAWLIQATTFKYFVKPYRRKL